MPRDRNSASLEESLPSSQNFPTSRSAGDFEDSVCDQLLILTFSPYHNGQTRWEKGKALPAHPEPMLTSGRVAVAEEVAAVVLDRITGQIKQTSIDTMTSSKNTTINLVWYQMKSGNNSGQP